MIARILNTSSLVMFLLAGGMTYAYVFDVDPISPEKTYLLERDYFNRTNDNWNLEFPSYGEWLSHREEGEQRFKDWIIQKTEEFGLEFAACFDPNIDPYSGKYVDLRQGHPASAPENPFKGERE